MHLKPPKRTLHDFRSGEFRRMRTRELRSCGLADLIMIYSKKKEKEKETLRVHPEKVHKV